jgi:hypothetical protein
MRLQYTRNELIEFVETNTNIEVYWEEIGERPNEEYIVITQLGDTTIKSDNLNHYISTEFQIQFRTKDRFDVNKIKKFMFDNFMCKSTKTYDEDNYYWLNTYYDIVLDFRD